MLYRNGPLVTFVYIAQAGRQTSLYPPLGIGYLVSSLKQHGFRTRIMDLTFDVNLSQIAVFTKGNPAGIYCVSFTTPYRNMAAEVIQRIKKEDPESTVIVGGPHATILPDDILKFKSVDIVVRGQGDYVLPEIIKAIEEGSGLEHIPGVVFLRNDKTIYASTEAPAIEDLDALPFPSQGDFPLDEYFSRKGFRELSLISSRGCPLQCTFCKPAIEKIFGKKLRFRSVKNVVDEIEKMIKDYSLDSFFFSDDTFTMNQERVIALSREIMKRRLRTFWRCASTVNLKKETLRVMRSAGCVSISFGVESGSSEILRNIEKNITVENTIRTFKACKELGIITWGFLMVGNVGETRETVEMTKDLVRKIKPFGASVAITTPLPGTKLYEYALEKEMLVSEEDTDYDYLFSQQYRNTLRLPDLKREEVLLLKAELEMVVAQSTRRVQDICRLLAYPQTVAWILRRIARKPVFLKVLFVFLWRVAVIKTLNILNPDAGKNAHF